MTTMNNETLTVAPPHQSEYTDLNLQLHATTNISNPGAFGIIGDTTFVADEYNAGIVESDLSQNGYAKFANGLIIQWGYSDGGEVKFPIRFPTKVLNIVVSPLVNNDGIGGNCWYVTTLTTTKFNTAVSVPRRWIAIGM